MGKRGKMPHSFKAKNPVPKSAHLKLLYKDRYVVLELVDGIGNHLGKATQSLAFLAQKLHGMLFATIVIVKRALQNSPEGRPAIKEIQRTLLPIVRN